MFRKSRKKIVFSVMIVLALFLVVTLATIYISNYLSLKQQNMEMLERYVSLYSINALPGTSAPGDVPDDGIIAEDGQVGNLPPLPPSASGEDGTQLSNGTIYQLSSFFSAAIAIDGDVLATDVGTNGLYTKERINSLAEDILLDGKKSGMWGSLMYLVEERDKYTLVAFLDTTLTENSLSTLFYQTLVVGAVSLGIFFGVSVALANWIIRPLEENDRKQRQFISDAEHELKTPIAVIGTNAELLERQIGENQWLSNIYYENDRMANLVREMLDLSHVENGKIPFEEIDLSKLVEREVLSFESVAFENGLMINSRVESGITVFGNYQQLGQLISILTDNAISHSEGENVIGIELKKGYRTAVLTVANPGKEIPEDERERLFDRFYRRDEARGESGGHFGLGLPIAKAITDAHRGGIHVECRAGKVIFTVTLPLKSKEIGTR